MLNFSNLYKAEWLDLVFQNRNRNYGAYALRIESASTTNKALLIAGPLFFLFFAGPMIYKRLNPIQELAQIDNSEKIVEMVNLSPKVEQPKPKEELEMPKAEPLNKKVKTVALPSRAVVVDDHKVKTEPPTVEQVKNAAIGPVTQDGEETDLAIAPVRGDGNGTGLGSAEGSGSGAASDHTVYEAVEVLPQFVGGMKAWEKFLTKNLRYPAMAQEAGVQGKVFISFVVEKDGSVTDVKVVRGIGGGCDEEAARVIGKSPRWIPGQQNAKKVRVRYQMPLSFSIAN